MTDAVGRLGHQAGPVGSGGARYHREPALPFLCVPACLNMVLERRKYATSPQVDLAKRLGLVVPQQCADEYPFAELSESPSDWGTPRATVEARISDILGELAPVLHHVYRRWQEIPSSSQLEFIADQVASGNDVAVGFDASKVYEGAEPSGHVALVMEVDCRADLVRLMDPERGSVDGVVVTWARLFSGIIAARDGYWLFGESLSMLRAG